MVTVSRFVKSYNLVIVTHIWQKLSSVERDVTLIVKNFWQLFPQIFGETAFVSSHRCDPDIRFLSMISTSGSSKTLAQLERQVKYGNRSRIRRPATKGVLTYCHFPQISGIGSSTNKLNTHPYFKYIWLSIPHIFGLPIYQDLRHSLALLI